MYWIVTDSATDLPKSYIDAQEQFQVLPITITLEGQTLVPDGTDEYARNIYAQLRAGQGRHHGADQQRNMEGKL